MGWYIWPERKEDQPTERDACSYCGRPIKPGDKFYLTQTPEGELVPDHAGCTWEAAEKKGS